MATLKPYKFVGSSETYWIPDDILVVIDIVPDSKIGWVRSGSENLSLVTLVTQHDTGTAGSTADGQRNYLHGGPMGRDASGRLVRRKVGFNFAADGVPRTVGDKQYRGKVIQLTPLNERTWAAGTDKGNSTSWHIEQCFDGANVWANSWYVNSCLAGALMAGQGWTISRLVQHNTWYGKDCPGQIRRRGLWPAYVNDVATTMSLAARAAGGDGTGGAVEPTPKPEPVPFSNPVKPAFWDAIQDGAPFALDGDTLWYPDGLLYRVKATTKRQQFAIKDGRVTGPDLVIGEKFRGEAKGQSKSDGKPWVVTPHLTRVDMAALEVVEEEEPIEISVAA
jgi:hypothetical protein